MVGATLAASSVTVLFCVAAVALVFLEQAGDAPAYSVGTWLAVAFAIWFTVVLMPLPAAGLVFTAAHLMLRAARQKFGWAFVVLGWLSGWLAATATVALAQSPLQVTFWSYAAFGVSGLVLGLVY